MSSVQQFQLGTETTALMRGRSMHGQWRCAYVEAGAPPDDAPLAPAGLAVMLDAGRLAFAITEGPAAAVLAERLADHLWVRGPEAIEDWPNALRSWLADTQEWADVSDGQTVFVCGQIERSVAGGQMHLAWLGMNGVQVLDCIHTPLTLDTVLYDDEGWTPENGPEPVGMALHAYRGNLYDLDRLVVYNAGAETLGEDLANMSHTDVQQALDDWGDEAERHLVFFDLRLNPVVTVPDSVIVTHHWTSPEQCMLTWLGGAEATGHRIEEASTPAFDDALLLAELTDARQIQYSFSPPIAGQRFYRVVPLNQGVPGQPSEPIPVTPMILVPPVMQPIQWADDGGLHLVWTSIPQATSYEVQCSSVKSFDPDESRVVYRGEFPEVYLPATTPVHRYFRVRAINVLYAPHSPSAWSRYVRAPARLDAPAFTSVTNKRLAWMPVIGARQYVVRVSPKGQDEGNGEDFYTTEPYCAAADQPATYAVRALRRPEDARTASDWSKPVTLAPGEGGAVMASRVRLALPVLIGAAGVALIVGAALGSVGMGIYQDHNATATRTPVPQALLDVTSTAEQQHINNATEVVNLGDQASALQATLDAQAAAEQTRAAIPTWTPSITPNASQTFEVGLLAALTGTASNWTETPTPTATRTPSITPDASQTFEVGLIAALTATASNWTATPSPTETLTPTHTLTPSITPNASQTFEVGLVAALTATASNWTETPTATETPIPTDTPDATETFEVAVAQMLTATAAAWTETPTATHTLPPSVTPISTNTPVPSATPDIQGTANALVTGLLPAGCFVIDPPDEALPVYAGPSTYYTLLSASVPRMAEVIARWERHDPDSDDTFETWFAVQYRDDVSLVSGWFLLPEDSDESALYDGSGCQPERHVPPLDVTDTDQVADTGVCLVVWREGDLTNVRSEPAESAPVLTLLSESFIVLERRVSDDAPDEGGWLRIWLDDRGLDGWIAADVVDLLPEGCGPAAD
ncbi:MAG: SH3 domain-containing protein [Anaerolineae bacterium]|nr:SH3 domain-containing protein [Anaerolineae bacterium]